MSALTLLPIDPVFSIGQFLSADAVAATLLTCRSMRDVILRMPSVQFELHCYSDDGAPQVRTWLQCVCHSSLARKHAGRLYFNHHFFPTSDDLTLLCALVSLASLDLHVWAGPHPPQWILPPSLKSLTITGMRGRTMSDTQVAGLMAGIALLTHLERLNLTIRRSFPVEPLLALPRLRELVMPQMTTAQVEPLRRMHSLRLLSLHGGKDNLSSEDVKVLAAFTRSPHQLQLTTFALGGIVCTGAIASLLSQVPTITDAQHCGIIAGSTLDFLLSWPHLTALHLSFTHPARVSAEELVAAVSQCKMVTQFGTMHREMTHQHFVELLASLPTLVDLRLWHHPLCDPQLLFQQAKLDSLTALELGSTMWRPLLAHPELFRPLMSIRQLDLSWIQPRADEISALRPPSRILPRLDTLVER